MASRVSVGPSPERITPNEMAVVELFERISSSGNLCFASSLVNGVRGHAGLLRAAGVEANALGEDEEHVATDGGVAARTGRYGGRRSRLHVPRRASRVTTEEPAHRMKPDHVGGGRLAVRKEQGTTSASPRQKAPQRRTREGFCAAGIHLRATIKMPKKATNGRTSAATKPGACSKLPREALGKRGPENGGVDIEVRVVLVVEISLGPYSERPEQHEQRLPNHRRAPRRRAARTSNVPQSTTLSTVASAYSGGRFR